MTVYVIQEPTRYDKATGKYVPAFDISSAREHGPFVYIFTPTATPWNSASWLPDLHAALCDFGDDDFLLCIGNPVLMCAATAYAAHRNKGRVKWLQWSGRERSYSVVEAQIF